MSRTPDRFRAFQELHKSGCFVILNPWDAGSARALAQLGFPALATTSSGFAWSQGRADNHVSIDEALRHFRAIADSVDVPVNGDFEGGFAIEPAGVAANVARATETGVAGLSIEDSTGDSSNPLLDFTLAVERIQAARAAIDAKGARLLLTGRSEGFIVGRPDLPETIRRLTAYAEAGADCLYAPGMDGFPESSHGDRRTRNVHEPGSRHFICGRKRAVPPAVSASKPRGQANHHSACGFPFCQKCTYGAI